MSEETVSALYSHLKTIARRLMASERHNHTLQPTALVHEAWIKLNARERREFNDQRHFLCVAARAMRQILIDHARSHKIKDPLTISEEPDTALIAQASFHSDDLIALDQAIAQLEKVDARLVSIVELRCFADLSVEETAEVLQLSPTTVKREWRIARSLLLSSLERSTP
jgi:RNA polymerase sigma factor (TIGR02999 family)